MIFYFTGTGNSRFVAEKIAEKIGDELISMNELFRNGSRREYESDVPFVFVYPIFAGGTPRVVAEFMKRVVLKGNHKVYVVATCGLSSNANIKKMEKLVAKKGLTLQGFEEIKIPDNYVLMYNPSTNEKGLQTIHEALPKINDVAEKIGKCEEFTLTRKINVGDKMISSKFVDNLFNNVIAKDKGFYTTDECTGCTKCEKECPVKNITMVENKPKWNGNCTHCVACISVCPHKAIEYKNKTQKRGRYYLPANSKVE